jgi:hypothetical protein
MPGYPRFTQAAAIILAVTLAGCQATPAPDATVDVGEINFEGLATVTSRTFELAQVRPGVDFGAYSRLLLGVPELAYRTPDRAAREVTLTEAQKDGFRDVLVAAFDEEFAGFKALQLTTEPGADTLTLDVRVEDIVATVARQPVGRGGRAAALLEASGDAVIVIELRDSQSNEILARGVDSGSTGGAAIRTSEAGLQARFRAADKLVSEWASKARRGVENLVGERR